MESLQSLELQLQNMRILLEDSILTNKPMLRLAEIYRRMKEVELLITDRKSLLNRKGSVN
jgi:hypothetical protein